MDLIRRLPCGRHRIQNADCSATVLLNRGVRIKQFVQAVEYLAHDFAFVPGVGIAAAEFLADLWSSQTFLCQRTRNEHMHRSQAMGVEDGGYGLPHFGEFMPCSVVDVGWALCTSHQRGQINPVLNFASLLQCGVLVDIVGRKEHCAVAAERAKGFGGHFVWVIEADFERPLIAWAALCIDGRAHLRFDPAACGDKFAEELVTHYMCARWHRHDGGDSHLRHDVCGCN